MQMVEQIEVAPSTETVKQKRLTKIEKLIAPHSFQEEFVQCLRNIEKEYGFDLFQISGIGKQLDMSWFAKQFFGKKTNTADVSVDSNSNVGLKNTVIYDQELSKPLKLIGSYYRMWKGMKKKYGLEYANEAVRKQITGEIYVNDFHGFQSSLYYSYYGKTVVTVKYRGQILSINMEELFKMFKDKVTIYPDRETIDLSDVNIYVLDKGDKFIKLTHVLRHKPHNDLLKFETKNGMTTIVTEDHPMILEDGTEKLACEVTQGDKLMMSDCVYKIFNDGGHIINRAKYLIGFAIGDGFLTRGVDDEYSQVTISQKDIGETKVYDYICEESPHTANTIHPCGYGNRVEFVVFGNKCWVCKNAQFGKGAQNKYLPKDILNWNRSEILSLIAGLIDSDGCVNKANGCIDIRVCGFSVVQQVAELLRSLGFERVRTSQMNVQQRMGSFGNNYDMYRVSFVCTDEDLINFSDKLSENRAIVTRERGIDGRFETNEVLKVVPMMQEKPEYVYDITTETGHFHCQGMIQHNCYNYSTLDTAHKGIPRGIDAEPSRPTKYLGTFLEHLQLFCIHAGSSSLGAVGLADLLLTMSCYVKRVLETQSDHKAKFASEEDCWVYIRAKLRNFIYFLNQPNRIVQSLFSNVSIYDDHFLDSLLEYYFIEDKQTGEMFFAEKDIVKKLQELFLDIMNETMSERITTFPVVTACFSLNDERDIQEPEFLEWVLEQDKKFRFVNLYAGATSTLSSCCFGENQKVLVRINGIEKESTFNEIAHTNIATLDVMTDKGYRRADFIRLDNEGFMVDISFSDREPIHATVNHIFPTEYGDMTAAEISKKITVDGLDSVRLVDSEGKLVSITSIGISNLNDPVVYCFVMEDATYPYFVLANGIKVHNCRLRSDKTNKYMNSLGSGSTKIGCYDDKTEVLTSNGWKLFKDVDLESDLVATMDINTRSQSFQKPSEYHEYNYEGDMINFKANNYNLCVTPNHRMVVQSSKTGLLSFQMAEERLGKHSTRLGQALPIEQTLQNEYKVFPACKCANNKTYPEIRIPMDVWVSFMGIYLSEGCCNREGNTSNHGTERYRVSISQVKKSNCEKISALLDKMGVKWNYSSSNFSFESIQIYEYLRQFGDKFTRYIPEDLKSLPVEYLNILWNWLLLGDGHVNKKSKAEMYWTVSKRLADDIQDILARMGYLSGTSIGKKKDSYVGDRLIAKENLHDCYRIVKYRKPYSMLYRSRVFKSYYCGKVYCLSVPNQTLLVRRNGMVAWCGNSLGVCTQNLPRLASMSGGNIDRFKRMLGDNVRLSQRINGVKRSIIKKAIDSKMIPLYNLGYTLLNSQFQTTGIVGLYEAIETLGYDIKTDEGEALAEDILVYINQVTDEMSEELGVPCNVEQIPAENVAVKLAKKDRLLGFNDKYDIYSNQYIPLKDNEADLFTRIRLVAHLDKYMSGGSILHININEENVDTKALAELAKAMYKQGVVYFAFNKLLAECADCGKIFTTNKEAFDANEFICPDCGSSNTECALRIVGFIRKFSSWSSERQAEGRQRKFYSGLVKGA